VNDSPHRENYRALEARLRSEAAVVPFTLPPTEVLHALIHALESRRPKIRYRVTLPTRLFAVLKRLLPDAWMDRLLIRISGGARR